MNNSKISCVPHARRLFIPAANSSRLNQRARFNTFRSKRQPVFRAALKSPAPSDLGTPTSLVSAPPLYTDTTPHHSSHLAVLSHLAELEALLCFSSPALELLHQLREEVATCFQSPLEEIIDEDILEYDRGHNFGTRNTISSSFGSALNLDLDFDLGSRYAHLTAELSTLSLDEAKDKIYALSTQGYDDTKSKFDSLKSLFVSKVRRCADVALPNIPTSSNISVLLMVMPDLHTRLDEVWAALRKDVPFAVDRLVLFVANLVGDGDGDVSWEDARWKGLISHPEPRAEVDKGNERGYKVDMHTLALEKSQGGDKLIRYRHLPERWRNNEFVWEGYRFIPGTRWPALVLSMFQLHNETVNIQTHFVPLLSILFVALPWELTVTRHPFFSGLPSLSLFGVSPLGFTPLPPSPADPMPKFFYLLAAGACLACSAIWHTLAGCSDLWLFEAGARIDYVGIGWLISASVSGIVYYGFACQPAIMWFYISIAIMTGIAGSILPFQAWFDERKNKKWRIAFFLFCAGSAVVPLGHLSYKHSFSPTWEFIEPFAPSVLCDLTALAFYAIHFPECCFPGCFDWAGSHAIWHVFIAIGESRLGFGAGSDVSFISCLAMKRGCADPNPILSLIRLESALGARFISDIGQTQTLGWGGIVKSPKKGCWALSLHAYLRTWVGMLELGWFLENIYIKFDSMIQIRESPLYQLKLALG